MKPINLFLFILILASCNSRKPASVLPFYDSADFTPQWLATGDKAITHLHRVASFDFINQDSLHINPKKLDGKIYVANFFFTTCGSICPRMMTNLKKVSTAFDHNDRVRLLSFSVLPESDSVSKLKSYAQKRGIDNRQWWLLTGNRQQIYHLARTSYFADDSLGNSADGTDFLHTENCVLVDGQGHLRGVYNATVELEMDQLIKHIGILLKEQ